MHSLLFGMDNNVAFQKQKNICKKIALSNSKLVSHGVENFTLLSNELCYTIISI